MFRMARAENNIEGRITDLVAQVRALREHVLARDVDQRVAMSKVRMDAFQLRLSETGSRSRNTASFYKISRRRYA